MNHTDFAAFRLSVAYLAHLYWRHAAVCGLSEAARATTLAEVARRDAGLAAALTADWQSTRVVDPLAGADQIAVWGFAPEDWLHGRFLAAAQYTAQFLSAR